MASHHRAFVIYAARQHLKCNRCQLESLELTPVHLSLSLFPATCSAKRTLCVPAFDIAGWLAGRQESPLAGPTAQLAKSKRPPPPWPLLLDKLIAAAITSLTLLLNHKSQQHSPDGQDKQATRVMASAGALSQLTPRALIQRCWWCQCLAYPCLRVMIFSCRWACRRCATLCVLRRH